MDIFKFTPTGADTALDQGAQVNDIKKKTWVERYSTPGEFTLEGLLSSGLSAALPLGTLISHTDTLEVMIVENHEIDESRNGDPTIKVTGRSLPSWLEGRPVGVNNLNIGKAIVPYSLAANYTWIQAANLINDHITSPPAPAGNVLTNVVATYSVAGTGVSVARPVEIKPVWDAVDDILKIDNLGIRTIRRNTFGGLGSSTQTYIDIYKGVDKTATVMFSWVSGDIEEAKYLFSQKTDYNAALVVGQYVVVDVYGSETDYDRRMMIVDGKDIDGHLGAMPTGQTLTDVITAMTTRGNQAISGQNQTSIAQVDLATDNGYRYRTDYNLGDIVRVDGNFGQIDTRRVTEYAEIEDEDGVTGHPTLSIV